MTRRRLTGTLAGLVIAVGLAGPMVGCTTNPATGRSQFNALSRQEEIALGSEASPQFLAQAGGNLPDAYVNEYVNDIGQKMAAQTEGQNPELPWEFHVVDSDMINAFALPGGKVFVSRGLLSKMTNEAQLAGVLGHEVGHVTARHANDRYAQQILVTVGVVGASVAASQSDDDAVRYGVPAATALAGTLWTLSYSRGQELEADRLGVRYMTAAGYNPIGQIEVMKILKEAGGGRGGVEFLQTHPLPETRIAKLEQLVITGPYASVTHDPRYVTNPIGFQRDVLDRLAKLPPAKHTGGQPAEAKLHDFVERAWAEHHARNGGWSVGCGDGCVH